MLFPYVLSSKITVPVFKNRVSESITCIMLCRTRIAKSQMTYIAKSTSLWLYPYPEILFRSNNYPRGIGSYTRIDDISYLRSIYTSRQVLNKILMPLNSQQLSFDSCIKPLYSHIIT